MAKGVYFNLTLHNHQPVGNFAWVFQEAFERAYLPTLELLEAFPSVPVTLHYSGPLWDWLRQAQPGFLARLKKLVERGQVELLAGAYYEPILAAIPKRDQIAQIRAMRRRLKEEFGVEARGMWLAERVWEPHLAEPMARAGIEFTVLDDTHFISAGVEPGETFGYYVTEHEGRLLRVVPSLKELRYLTPWRPVEETLGYLRAVASQTPRLACMGDDGEKFGLWPETYGSVWGEGWFHELMEAVVEHARWLWPVRLDEYLRRFPPLGRIYLPTASYVEMTEWALPAARALALERVRERLQALDEAEALGFLRGTFWRNFLVKYPEANRMHKRMYRAHRLVWQRPEPERALALEDLWRSQGNCPYWHGVFGGLYLPHIRSTNWQNLLSAEIQAERLARGPGPWRYQGTEDLDGDGLEELILATDRLFLAVDPRHGGRLLALDGRRVPWSYLDTISRRPEAYHQRLDRAGIAPDARRAVGAGEAVLRYDAYERLALLDHFLAKGCTLEGFAGGKCREGGDFLSEAYDFELGEGEVRLWRQGRALGRRVVVRKHLRLEPGADGLAVELEVRNEDKRPFRGRYGSEWNLALLWGHSDQAGYRIPGRTLADPLLDSRGEAKDVEEVAVVTPPLGIGLRLRTEQPATLWRLPLCTLSNSESGLESVYQASTLVWLWELDLPPGGMWRTTLTVSLAEG